jgi:Leucine-rich repeat (LRR) protein
VIFFIAGGVLSSIVQLEELYVKIKEATLSDQLLGGITPKLRRLSITGSELKKIDAGALEGVQNTFQMDLSITGTNIEEVPPRIFDLLRSLSWARLNLSFNKMSSLDSTALYPNKTVWFSRGTKILEGLFIKYQHLNKVVKLLI